MPESGRRAQILAAARTLFREKGYHATTIRDIAEVCGLLSGSLYAHIRTKEDLLFEIVDDIADQFLVDMRRVLLAGGKPADQFRNALTAHISVVARNLDAATVFSHEWRALVGQRRETIQRKRDEYEQLWNVLLSEGAADGSLRAAHRRFSRLVILSVANWVYQWYDLDGQLSPQEVAERLADVLLRGLQENGRMDTSIQGDGAQRRTAPGPDGEDLL